MKKLLLTVVMSVMACFMVNAQTDGPVVINGSLVNWYYQSPDSTGKMVWNQFAPGGEKWIDPQGYEHTTTANRGLLSLKLSPGSSMPLSPEFRVRNALLYGNCGGIYKGGNEFYAFYGHEVEIYKMDGEEMYIDTEQEIDVLKWTWDSVASDGTYAGAKYDVLGKIEYEPTDLAYYPEDDIVYGVFKTETGGYRLATIDLTTLLINFISVNEMQEGRELRTLACNSKGQLFGTDMNGNIYSVSSTDGKLKRIGNMGFRSQNDMMSATIDYRTDKMYWMGFLNNGLNSTPDEEGNYTRSVADGGRDTGIYEIDTETGEAQLIGKTNFINIVYDYDEDGQVIDVHAEKYGKMQMTGIYVEGSIVRPTYDLKVTVKSSPLQLAVGQESYNNVVVTVKNRGEMPIRGKSYALALYADDLLVGYVDSIGSENVTRTLAPFATQDYYFSYNKPQSAGDKTLRVFVVCDIDEKKENNTDAATVHVVSTTQLPVPEITGDIDEGRVILSWRNPRGRIVEGAEDYMPFSYDGMGAWIMYDGDGGYTQSINSISFLNWNAPKAYIVMNPKEAKLNKTNGGKRFLAHGGKNYFAAWWTAATPDGSYRVPNNDWLISPKLSGMPHTVSFWARGIDGTEQMRVLATEKEYKSVYDMNAEDWTVVKETFQVSSSEWTEYKIQVLQQYKHFALQCCSQSGHALLLDDIAYEIPLKTLTGYRVYRNGQLVSFLTANTSTYVDSNPGTDYSYYVTALYEEGGESKPSNTFPEPEPEEEPEPEILPADVNEDGIVDVSDVGLIIDFMAVGIYDQKADVNSDGIIDVADIALVIEYMAAY